MLRILILCYVLIFSCSTAFAEKLSFDDFPQSGVLAANGNLPSGSLALPQLPMGLLGQPTPILGAISLGNDGKWTFSVQNNANRPIKLSVDLVQFDGNRNKISSSKYQYKLKSGRSEKNSVPAALHSSGAVIFLKEWSWMD